MAELRGGSTIAGYEILHKGNTTQATLTDILGYTPVNKAGDTITGELTAEILKISSSGDWDIGDNPSYYYFFNRHASNTKGLPQYAGNWSQDNYWGIGTKDPTTASIRIGKVNNLSPISWNTDQSGIELYVGDNKVFHNGNLIIESDIQPTTNLSNGLMWYNTTTQQLFIYINGSFISMNNKMLKYTNSVTLSSDSNTVSIGISDFNKDVDILFVHSNTVYLSPDSEYTFSNTTITKTSGTWVSGTVFDFMIIKSASSHLIDTTKGVSNFVGSGLEKTIAHGLNATPSAVSITSIENANGNLGEYWCRYDATNIYVGNTGVWTGQFSWIAML